MSLEKAGARGAAEAEYRFGGKPRPPRVTDRDELDDATSDGTNGAAEADRRFGPIQRD